MEGADEGSAQEFGSQEESVRVRPAALLAAGVALGGLASAGAANW